MAERKAFLLRVDPAVLDALPSGGRADLGEPAEPVARRHPAIHQEVAAGDESTVRAHEQRADDPDRLGFHEQLPGSARCDPCRAVTDPDILAGLFAEELGAVVQVRDADAVAVIETFRRHGVAARVVGRPTKDDQVGAVLDGRVVYRRSRADLQRAWSETTWQMQSLRDNPECAQQEYDVVARISEWKFGMILPEAEDGKMSAIPRIKKAVLAEADELRKRHKDLKVEVRFGHAAYLDDGEDYEKLIFKSNILKT